MGVNYSGWQLARWEFSWAKNFPGGNCQVGVILGGNFSSGNCPGGSYPGWKVSGWELSGC